MAVINTKYAKREIPLPYPKQAGEVVAYRFTYTVPTSITEGDIIELAVLPAFCRVVDAIFDSADLDTNVSPEIVWDIGVMSGAVGDTGTRTCGDELFDGITTSQAGGVVRPTLQKAFQIATSSDHRSIGAKLVTDAATAAAGEIGLTLYIATV